MIAACAFCGRENEAGSRFCMDCGKPLNPSAARAVALHNRPRISDPDMAESRHARGGSPATYPAPQRLSGSGAGGGAAAGAGSSGGAGMGPVAPVVPPTRVSPQGGAAATMPCPRCARQVDASLPWCGACGARLTPTAAQPGTCAACNSAYAPGDLFCSRCGTRVGSRVSAETSAPPDTVAFTARREVRGPKLALLDDHGDVATVFTLERGEAVVGRGDADIRFADDAYMSPLHARLEMRDGTLWLRDLGSRNMSWVFIDEPMRLADGDLMLVGSQVLRFRRLGFPGPYTPEVDSTRRMGSLTPSSDVAELEQLRADGSVRDTLHLSPGRNVVIGREMGDWVFPYDQTMSGRHAEIRSEDADFLLHDVGSRNGIAVAVRGGRALKPGQRLLLGDQLFRVEST